jgi:hypothetical protein
MPRTIRFHLDESCSSAVAQGLRRRGIDVTTTHEEGLRSTSDEDQLAFAHTQGRVILTHDSDYVKLHRNGVGHSGILYCLQRRRSIGELVRLLTLAWDSSEPSDYHNQLKYL